MGRAVTGVLNVTQPQKSFDTLEVKIIIFYDIY